MVKREFLNDGLSSLKEYGVTDRALEAVYRKAYEDGHYAGYQEVYNYFLEECDMLEEVFKRMNEK